MTGRGAQAPGGNQSPAERSTDRGVGPFSGLTVVEFGQFVVAPFCGQFLADGGARVIKVEPPEGDSYRLTDQIGALESRQYVIKNRGKASIAIQLAHPRSAEVVRRLIEVADVVIVNMRLESVKRRGLRYSDVAAINPRLVYGGVTAFGSTGPEASYPGMDVVVQARSGLLLALGAERHGVPHHSEVQVADYTTAMLLLAGIATALYTRAVTGKGQEVQVSLLGGALTIQNNVLGHFYEHDQWRDEFVNETLPRARREGWSVEQIDDARRAMREDPRDTTYYRVFKTADDTIAVGGGSPRIREAFLREAGLRDEESPADGVVRRREADATMRTRTTEEWVTALRNAGVPVATVAHVDELLLDPQAEAEGLVWEGEHEIVGRYRSLGVPIQLSQTPFRPPGSSPAFARDTVPILLELGFTREQIDGLVDAGAVVTSESSGLLDEEWPESAAPVRRGQP